MHGLKLAGWLLCLEYGSSQAFTFADRVAPPLLCSLGTSSSPRRRASWTTRRREGKSSEERCEERRHSLWAQGSTQTSAQRLISFTVIVVLQMTLTGAVGMESYLRRMQLPQVAQLIIIPCLPAGHGLLLLSTGSRREDVGHQQRLLTCKNTKI